MAEEGTPPVSNERDQGDEKKIEGESACLENCGNGLAYTKER